MTQGKLSEETGTGICPDPAIWHSVGTIEHCSWNPASLTNPLCPSPLTHLHPLPSRGTFFPFSVLLSSFSYPCQRASPPFPPPPLPEAGSQFHQPTFRDNRHFTQFDLHFPPCGNSISVLPNYRMAKIRQPRQGDVWGTYIQVLM